VYAGDLLVITGHVPALADCVCRTRLPFGVDGHAVAPRTANRILEGSPPCESVVVLQLLLVAVSKRDLCPGNVLILNLAVVAMPGATARIVADEAVAVPGKASSPATVPAILRR